MASIFDILLNRGKIEAQIESKLGGKKDIGLLAHQNEFKEFLYLLNQFIKEEIHLIDEMLVDSLKKKHDVPSTTTHFIHQVSLKMFGSLYSLVLDDYHKFVQGFTAYSQLEANLRAYLIRIIQSECHFDIYSGENNLEDIADRFVKTLDDWLLYIASKPAYRDTINNFIRENYDGKEQRFMNVLMYFVALMIISSLFLEKVKQGVFKTKYGQNLMEMISKIYYRNTLSLDQYKLLQEYGLEGGIAYRGLSLDLKHTMQLLTSKEAMRGTSWTSNYFLALDFASQNNVKEIMHKVFTRQEGFQIRSARELQRLMIKAKSQNLFDERLYLFIDDPETALNVLVFIQESKKWAMKEAKQYYVEVAPKHDVAIGWTSKGDATIGVILSYDVINDKVLVYLGEGAPKHFVSEKWLTQKEIVISVPRKFSLSPSAFDMVVPIMLRRLELEFIGEEGFVVVKKILEENLVSQEVIKFIEAEKNKMTVDKLNAYLKSQNVYGKIIGKVNIAFRKK